MRPTTYLSFVLYCCLFWAACQPSKPTDTTAEAPTTIDSTIVTPPAVPATPLVVAVQEGELDTIVSAYAKAHERVHFYAPDSLLLSANYYPATGVVKGAILLCHQAGWNKYEYDSTAVVLQQRGYHCLALDQRSGGTMGVWEDGGGPINQSYHRASAQGLKTDYLSAEQDMLAGIEYLSSKVAMPVILWGSSYSAALALHLGFEQEQVRAIIAFSPGDYFDDKKPSLKSVLAKANKPYFITSSKKEAEDIKPMLPKASKSSQIQFIPDLAGEHGARALWSSKTAHPSYWKAIHDYLTSLETEEK